MSNTPFQSGDCENYINPAERKLVVVSNRWKWATVIGNAAIGLAEMISGNVTTLSVTTDGAHNFLGDSWSFYLQAENARNPNLTEQKRAQRRKLAHWAIASSSLAVGAKAGFDWVYNHEGAQHAAAFPAAAASLLLSGVLVTGLHRGLKTRGDRPISVHERDLLKHFWQVDIPSAGLAVTGALLQKVNVDIEQAAAVASGLLGAWAFRPTKRNLKNSCLDHDHSAGFTSGKGGHDHC